MKKLVLLFAIALSCASVKAEDRSFGWTADTKVITLSTTASQPTTIVADGRSNYIQKTLIISTMPIVIFLSTVSTNLSSASFALPVGSTGTPMYFSPDGVYAPYGGPLFGFTNNATLGTISVFRSR